MMWLMLSWNSLDICGVESSFKLSKQGIAKALNRGCKWQADQHVCSRQLHKAGLLMAKLIYDW